MKKTKVPGTIFLNKNRYWWKVKLPGETKIKYVPLKPKGAQFATKDRSVATYVAMGILKHHRQKQDNSKYNGTIESLVGKYLIYAKAYYGEAGKKHIRYETTHLLNRYSDLLAEDFSPKKLRKVREDMIDAGLARKTINDRTARIKRLFKWAVSEELVPQFVFESLQSIDGLRKNRAIPRVDNINELVKPKETKRIKAVADKHVDASLPYMSNVVSAMVQLQRITGMRSTEICIMKPCNLDRSGEVWLYKPDRFKNLWRETATEKIIYLGPQAQAIIKPFLFRSKEEYCFKPSESAIWHNQQRHEKRVTPLKQGNQPGTNKKGTQTFQPCYNKNSYRKAIHHAIAAARKAGQEIPDWHPHQLRHLATTRIRKQLGKEAAQAVLGHSDSVMTEHYSREVAQSLAKEAVKKIG